MDSVHQVDSWGRVYVGDCYAESWFRVEVQGLNRIVLTKVYPPIGQYDDGIFRVNDWGWLYVGKELADRCCSLTIKPAVLNHNITEQSMSKSHTFRHKEAGGE